MKHLRNPCCCKKLSAQIPAASLASAKKKLNTLNQLAAESTAIAEELNQISQQLMSPVWSEANYKNIRVFSSADENFGFITRILGKSIGLITGKYDILEGKAQAGVAYIESITNQELVSHQILEPLLKGKADENTSFGTILTLIQTKFIAVPNVKTTNRLEQVVENLLIGNTALFITGINTALIIDSRKIEKRSLEKPDNEGTVLSSLEAFIEDIEINCSMIIKRLPIPNLHFELFSVGILSKTKVKLIWIEGIANAGIVAEARRRIQKIDIDTVDGIGILSELIEDTPLSIFPKFQQTQRPDLVAKALANGQFAVLCNNSPFAFLAPIAFWDNFKSMDDYAELTITACYLRLGRIIAYAFSVIISPLYLAFVTYNQIIVPQSLAVTIAAGREGVPFPSGVELLLMTFGMTIIREAALRIPGSVGYFIGTLAAIVIGQAAVAAGYVSASIIIVVAISEISSFAVATTRITYTSRLINYSFIILAGFLGMFGLICGIVIIFWHLSSLESFGVPYLYPFIPFDLEGMKDTFIRMRLSVLKKRLRILAPFNRVRIGNDK